MLTYDQLTEDFNKLAPEQKILYAHLNTEILAKKSVSHILKDKDIDQEVKKGILTTSCVVTNGETSRVHNLLTLAINCDNHLAAKEILQECKQLGILEQVLTAQSLHIVNGHQQRSLYALHLAIIYNYVELCTEVLNAASNEPGLLRKILELELTYTKTDITKTYTPLQLAETKENTVVINIVKPKMQEAGLTVPEQPPVNTDNKAFQEEELNLDALPLPQQDGQPQEEGSMLSRDSLSNDEQKVLYSDLKQAIEDGSDPKNILGGSIIKDVDAVFGIRITTEDGCQHNFLTYAIKHNNDLAVAHIFTFARTSLKNLLNDRPIIGTYKGEDDMDIAYHMTALEYAREQENEEYEQLITKHMELECMSVPARQNLPPLDEGRPASKASATSAAQSDPQQGEHDQQRDGIRNLYTQLYSNIVNDNPQVAKDSLNALLKQDNEKFKKVVDFKERGMVPLRENIQQKLQDLEYNTGDQELIEILETCVGRINLIDAKLEVLDQQQTVNSGSPVSSETSATPATPPLIPQGSQHQQDRTGGFYSRETSMSSERSDDEGEHQGASKTPTFWDEDEDQSVPKKPTFWDKHKGKIAAVSGVVGILCIAGALFAGLTLEIACIVGVIGALAILAAGKMVYDKVSDMATKWEVSKSKAAGTMLKDLFFKQPERMPSV